MALGFLVSSALNLQEGHTVVMHLVPRETLPESNLSGQSISVLCRPAVQLEFFLKEISTEQVFERREFKKCFFRAFSSYDQI